MVYLILFFLIAVAWFVWHRINNQKTLSGDFSKLKGPLVIFDFDGTICPSFDMFLDELNALSGSFGYRKVANEERGYLRDLPAKEVLRSLGISSWKLPFLIKKLRHNVQSRILNLEPVAGMSDILHRLKDRGVSMGILTSNSQENVHAWLKMHQLDFFDFIFTGNNLFGKDKHLKRISQNATDVYYVGDEVRDMEAAKRARIKAVAVTWGYNSHEGLMLAKPDYICNNAAELDRIFL